MRKTELIPVVAAAMLVAAAASAQSPPSERAKAAKAAAPKPAMSPKAGTAAELSLRERVAAYWKVRETTNLHAAYPFYEPAFREKYTADGFARDFRRLDRFAPQFVGVDTLAIDPSGARATVKIKLRTKPDVLGGQELVSVTEEAWVHVDGVWWKGAEPTLPSL